MAPARWATAQSRAIRARRACKKRSISRSSTVNPSGPLRRRFCASVSATGLRSIATALHAASGRRGEIPASRNDGRGEATLWYRQAQRSALRYTRGHARRLLGSHSDRAPRHQSALLRTAFRIRGETGCPVLVNTSFNVRGEPIVCMPEDAFRCFMGTEIEMLAVGNCFLRKDAGKNPALKQDYKDAFELD